MSEWRIRLHYRVMESGSHFFELRGFDGVNVLHPEYTAREKESVEEIAAWCEENFGAEDWRRWVHFSRIIIFSDQTMACAFRLRWM